MAQLNEEIRRQLIDALRQGMVEETEELSRKSISDGVDPFELINLVLIPTMEEVGELFQNNEIFLPELMMTGEASKKLSAVVNEAVRLSGQKVAHKGTVVICTVKGDQHDIGKNVLATLLASNGFRVVNLGRDVAPSAIVDAAENERADIVALSALMTTTRPAQGGTINLFTELGLREKYRILVGGAAASPDWAREIGADGYAPNAQAAVKLCKSLVEV